MVRTHAEMSDWVWAGIGLLGWLIAMFLLLGALSFCEDRPVPRPLSAPSNVFRVPAEKTR